MDHPLDRPVWNMLTGRQAGLARGDARALRIDPGYGPFAAARDASAEAQTGLGALLEGDRDVLWLVEPKEWPVPPGARIVRTAPLLQMVAEAPVPPQPGDVEAVVLGEDDAAEMAALAYATEPGPWGELTRHYGTFHGIRRQGRLVAMAGERMRPGERLAEVSGVCTLPDYRGQGLAAGLIRTVMAGLVARGDTPFLHSYAGNISAIRLYQSLGFSPRREMVVTVLARA